VRECVIAAILVNMCLGSVLLVINNFASAVKGYHSLKILVAQEMLINMSKKRAQSVGWLIKRFQHVLNVKGIFALDVEVFRG